MVKNKELKDDSQAKSNWKKSPLFIGAILGILLGLIISVFEKNSNSLNHETISNIFSNPWKLIIFILILFVSYFINIILHEAGHLLFGRLSGYTFASFRIGSATFVKEDGKIKKKKFNIPGTGGQCLLMPPDVAPEECPYILYNLGGALVNFILSTVCAICSMMLPVSFFIQIMILVAALVGYLIFIINILPIKISGIATDGYNLLALGKDSAARNAFYISLKVNGLNSSGTMMREMPLKWLILSNHADLSNPMNTAIRSMEGSWYQDNKEFARAKVCYESLIDQDFRILGFYENEIKCELLFIELITSCCETEINRLYTGQLKKHIESTKNYISKIRLMYAYELLYKKNNEAAARLYEQFEQAVLVYPFKGEILSETETMKYIKNMETM